MSTEDRPTEFYCEDCELTWSAQDCDHGRIYGVWTAHCPQCRRDIHPPENDEQDS